MIVNQIFANWERVRRLVPVATIAGVFLICQFCSSQAYAEIQVQLDAKRSGPRVVESITERGIVRDYRAAWLNLAQALEFNTPGSLAGSFTGEVQQWLAATISSQQQTGLTQRYLDQTHKLEVVFYAPEGDVIELHDTAQYQLQVLDSRKLLHSESVIIHYVVLITPGADRWVIRQLQAVPQF
jgi:hypothetical protein